MAAATRVRARASSREKAGTLPVFNHPQLGGDRGPSIRAADGVLCQNQYSPHTHAIAKIAHSRRAIRSASDSGSSGSSSDTLGKPPWGLNSLELLCENHLHVRSEGPRQSANHVLPATGTGATSTIRPPGLIRFTDGSSHPIRTGGSSPSIWLYRTEISVPQR